MVNQLRVTTTFLLLALLVMAWQCDDDYPLEEFKYNFEEMVDILPVKKSYKLGDTIWINYQNNDKRLFDAISKQDILTDSISLGFNVSFEGTYYSLLYPSGGHCEFITSDRNIDQATTRSGESTAALSLTYGCANVQRFEVGVVLKQKGIYKLSLYQYSPINRVVSCTGQPAAFPLSTIDYKFNVADANKDVYLSIPPISRGESPKGTTESKIDNKQMFIVKVE